MDVLRPTTVLAEKPDMCSNAGFTRRMRVSASVTMTASVAFKNTASLSLCIWVFCRAAVMSREMPPMPVMTPSALSRGNLCVVKNRISPSRGMNMFSSMLIVCPLPRIAWSLISWAMASRTDITASRGCLSRLGMSFSNASSNAWLARVKRPWRSVLKIRSSLLSISVWNNCFCVDMATSVERSTSNANTRWSMW